MNCVVLYGIYSDNYKHVYRMIENIIYMCISLKELDEEKKKEFKVYSHYPLVYPNTLKRLGKKSYIDTKCNEMGKEMIKKHEEVNNIKFSNTYIKPFDFYGIYELISDFYVNINGVPLHLSELSKLDRYNIYSMFDGKIIELEEYRNIKKNKKEDLCVVMSVIYNSKESFSYSDRRSIFSPRERLEQTIEQCKHLKERGFTVYLCEGSLLSFNDIKMLIPYVDKLIFFYYDNIGNYYANKCKNKSIFEVYVLKHIIENEIFTHFYKMTGRYDLLSSFDINTFKKDKPCFKILDGNVSFTGKNICENVFYSIPYSYKEKYVNIYRKIEEDMKTDDNKSIEDSLVENMGDDFYNIDYLNVIGKDGIFSIINSV